MKASSFLSGTKVYEFNFKNNNKIHFAIAKNKETLSNYYLNDITNIHVRKEIKIDESCGYMDVILDENTPAKNLGFYLMDFDVHFNDSENSNNKGFELSLDEAKAYIEQYNGTNESYFKDYKGGIVSIVNIETGETVYEEEIK